MSKPTSKKELLAEISRERGKFEALLAEIPKTMKNKEVTDGMSVKDFLAHRTEWGKMVMRWHDEAKAGNEPAVPDKDYKWSQLPELNAQIQKRYANKSLKAIEADFAEVHDALFKRVSKMGENELLVKGFYSFTKSTNLAAYINSSTAAHYRSADKHIRKWWKQSNPK